METIFYLACINCSNEFVEYEDVDRDCPYCESNEIAVCGIREGNMKEIKVKHLPENIREKIIDGLALELYLEEGMTTNSKNHHEAICELLEMKLKDIPDYQNYI